MRHALARAAAIALALGGALAPAALRAGPVNLEQTFYHNGNMNGSPWSPPAIDVAADGTVAVAINRTVGPSNVPQNAWYVLLYDSSGEPTAEIAGKNTTMIDVAFGPDGRVYTAEGWFGTGSHIYDRAGAKPRIVPVRFFKADGAHVDRGGPRSVGVAPDFRLYTVSSFAGQSKLYVLSPEDKLLQALELPQGAATQKVDVAPDGTVYLGSKVLQADGTWKDYPHTVRDIRPDGRLLVDKGAGKWGVWDPAAARLELEGQYPKDFDWADAALGPDNHVYLAPRREPAIAYVVANAKGEIVLRRGADFDRLTVSIPDERLTAGVEVPVGLRLRSGRAEGCVPPTRILPADNRRPLEPRAFVAAVTTDPLASPRWQAVPLAAKGEGQATMRIPAGLHGRYTLRVTTAASAEAPGQKPLAVEKEFWIEPPDAAGYATLATLRNRTGFAPGEEVRILLSLAAKAALPETRVTFTLAHEGKALASLPVALGPVEAGKTASAVVLLPAALTRALAGMTCEASVADRPAGMGATAITVAFGPAVRETDFELGLHSIGGSVDYQKQAATALLHREIGATHAVHAEGSGNLPGTYLDVATRLGLGFYYRPYGHFAACNWLPNEDGPMGVRMAWLAQRLAHYPASRGITYHDLYAPFGTWWDAPRKAGYDVYWKEWAKGVAVPPTVPEAARAKFLERRVQSLTLPRAYRAWGDAIRRADPRLARTTMQWWHQPLIETVPRLIAPALDFVTTQHAEEQYYHPVTVAHMVDLWRTAGKDLWCYGNATFQEDGSGAQTYRDLFAALMRAPQGVGPNGWHPMVEPDRAETETVQRVLGPMFRLLRACGGLAAASEPDDCVALWRSSYEEVYEGQRPPDRAHYYITTAIYTACLYGHRPAAILHDEDVLAGALGRYKVLLVSLEIPVPEPMQRKLAEFRAGGGLIVANRQPSGAWIPEGAVDLGPLFSKSHADHDCNNDFKRHVLLEREEGLRQGAKLMEAIGKAAAPFADCDDPTTWLSVHTSGQARYVWATNVKRLPHPPVDLHRFSAFEHTSCPTRTDIRLAAGDSVAVYDVFAGREVKPRKEAGALVVTADMTVLPGAAFAVLPAAIDRVQVAAGPLPEGRGIVLRASAADRRAKTICAAVPMELTLADPGGQVRYRFWRTAREGACEVAVPLSAADPAGTWQVTATELLSGRAMQADLAVPEPPPLAAPVLAPRVEWVRAGDATAALAKAKRVAVVTDTEQAEKLAAPADRLAQRLAAKGVQVSRLTAEEYLKDRTAFHWDKFAFAGAYSKEVQARPPRYDLVFTLDTPERPSSLYPKDLRTVEPRPADPGPGRAVIEYIVMPVYDTEDALALSGGDADGLLAAVDALGRPPAAAPVRPAAAPKTKDLRGRAVARTISPLRDVLGAPVWDLAASSDGKRILAGLMAWGNNLTCLSDDGKVLTSAPAGKYFPMRLAPIADGFALHVMENDPIVNYLLLASRDGKPERRLAATGRQIGGTRDASARFHDLWKQGLASVTPDGRFAAVGGSRGVAVWDLAAAKVLWRDDSLVHDQGGFAQVGLSPDGSRLAVAQGTRLVFRDGRTGAPLGSHEFPAGTKLGTVRMYDGHWLILGDTNLFAFRDGALQWQWSTPAEVTAQAFAADGLHWCVGGPDGSVRLMHGGTQAAGYKAPSGAVIRLAILADGSRVALATTTGWVGVLDASGACQWQQTVGSRAVIAFAGPAGHTVVGDWRGFVRRFDAKGKQLWATDLTPRVYRDDLATVLTAPDATPALYVPPPDVKRPGPPQGKENLAAKATVTHVVARSGGWRHELRPQEGGGAVLNNGQADDLTLPWYDEYAVSAVLGSEMKDHPAWEFAWKEPVTLAAIVVRECTKQPDAVPEEVAVQVWVEENGLGDWREVLHEYWNRGVVHAHAFGPVTTKKVRYIAHGDLGRNLWTTEIEAYGP